MGKRVRIASATGAPARLCMRQPDGQAPRPSGADTDLLGGDQKLALACRLQPGEIVACMV
jgi:hypothetical protein